MDSVNGVFYGNLLSGNYQLDTLVVCCGSREIQQFTLVFDCKLGAAIFYQRFLFLSSKTSTCFFLSQSISMVSSPILFTRASFSASCSCFSFAVSLFFLSKTVAMLSRNSDFQRLISCWQTSYLLAIAANVSSSRRTSRTIWAYSAGVYFLRLFMLLLYLSF